jgi:Ankyrin repeats (3 copies)
VSTRLATFVLTALFITGGICGCARHAEDSKEMNRRLIIAAHKGDTASVQTLLDIGSKHRDQRSERINRAGACCRLWLHRHGKSVVAERCRPVAGGLTGDALVDATRIASANKVKFLLEREQPLKAINEALFAVGESEIAVIQVATPAREIQSQIKQEPEGAFGFPAMDSADTARLLLEHGASTDERYGADVTPLIHAAEHGSTNVVTLLLEKGANVEARDNYGKTALIAAACDCAIIDMPDTLDSMKLLLQRGPTSMQRIKKGARP